MCFTSIICVTTSAALIISWVAFLPVITTWSSPLFREQIPVKFVGVGEGMDDLQPFDPGQFARALFGLEAPEPEA